MPLYYGWGGVTRMSVCTTVTSLTIMIESLRWLRLHVYCDCDSCYYCCYDDLYEVLVQPLLRVMLHVR